MNYSVERIQVSFTPSRWPRRFVFTLAEHVGNQDASAQLELQGWVVHPKFTISEVSLMRADELIASCPVDQHRPRVSEMFAGYPNANAAGFACTTDSPGVGVYRIVLLTDTGKRLQAGKLELHRQTEPRLIFMHIPKAAGSTLNQWLASHYQASRYQVHIESQAGWREAPKKYRELDFVSGHVPIGRLARHFDLQNEYFLTVVREPFAQLASHLAWVRRLSDSGEEHRFRAHPAFAQGLSRKLAGLDLSDPASLRELLERLEQAEIRLLDNCQVRYFSSPPPDAEVTEAHLAKALDNARLFDRIGFAERLAEFMSDVARDMNWTPPARVRRQNVSPSYYGLDVQNPETREALRPLVRFDLELYAALSRRS